MHPLHRPVRTLALTLLFAAGLTATAAGQLVVDFRSTAPAGLNPLEVTFTGSVTGGTAGNYQWDFGDGTELAVLTPDVTHTYTAPGVYTVRLFVLGFPDGGGIDTASETKVDYVSVSAATIQAAFAATSPTQGPNLHTVDFQDASTSTSSVTAWLWAFGDGGTSTEQSPSHTYTAPGTYSVSLTAFSGQQSDTTTQPDLVTVDPAVFAADFEASVTSGVQPLTVDFTDTTVAEAVTGWLWDFGDGATSTEQHPTHVYEVAEATTFSVSLTAFVGQQPDVLVRTDLIAVDPAPLVAAIDADASVGFGTFEVAFRDASQGGQTTAWLWDFGDGATSTERDPVHTYEVVGETTQHEVSLTVAIGPQEEQVTIPAFITQQPAMLRRDVLLEEDTSSILGADFDGDGAQDLMVRRYTGDDTIVAWLENLDGEGTFGPEQIIHTVIQGSVGAQPVDFDADGDPDVFVSGSSVPDPYWLENLDGLGTFSGPQPAGTDFGTFPDFQDVDGDGAVDVIDEQDDVIVWRENDGAGSYAPWAALTPVLASPITYGLGDLDGDGLDDLLVRTGESTGWMENTGGGAFGPFQAIGSIGPNQGSLLLAADVNGDGEQDLFVSAFWLGWYENLGGERFGPRQLVDVPSFTPRRLLDVDLDGDPDVLLDRWTGHSPVEISWLENLGGTFAEREPLVVPEASSALRILIDVDGDGDQDILERISASDTLVIQENRIGFDTWRGLGEGLAGAAGVPDLEGAGELAGGDTVTLSLRRALPGSSAYLVLGLAAVNAPFKGGVLVPSPDVLLAGLPVDADGRLVLDLPWPLGVPGDVSLYFQYWIVDEAAPAGLSSSNGLEGVTKP